MDKGDLIKERYDFGCDLIVCDDIDFLHDQIPLFLSSYFSELTIRNLYHCSNLRDVKSLTEKGMNVDIAILDINFAGAAGGLVRGAAYQGVEILELLRESISTQFAEVVMVTKYTELYGSEVFIRAIKAGASDWIDKEPGSKGVDNKCMFCGHVHDIAAVTSVIMPSCIQCGAPLKKMWRDLYFALARALYIIDIKKRFNLLKA